MRSRLEASHQKLRESNSLDNWNLFIDAQLKSWKSPNLQFRHKYHERFAAEAINAIILSAALCEATINAVLAIGLLQTDRAEIFELVEKNEVRQKWLSGPKLFAAQYSIPKDRQLYATLQFAIKMRNSFMHNKITISAHDTDESIDGSPHLDVSPDEAGRKLIQRVLWLPYDLHTNLLGTVEDQSLKFAFETVLHKKEKPLGW
jgi:hypothetical protein